MEEDEDEEEYEDGDEEDEDGGVDDGPAGAAGQREDHQKVLKDFYTVSAVSGARPFSDLWRVRWPKARR